MLPDRPLASARNAMTRPSTAATSCCSFLPMMSMPSCRRWHPSRHAPKSSEYRTAPITGKVSGRVSTSADRLRALAVVGAAHATTTAMHASSHRTRLRSPEFGTHGPSLDDGSYDYTHIRNSLTGRHLTRVRARQLIAQPCVSRRDMGCDRQVHGTHP